jgi:2Fe-2S ferredoxin
MARLTLIDFAGTNTTIDVAPGQSAMQAAVSAGIAGVVGECGGSAMCATCHVYVHLDWSARLPEPLTTELEMLDCTVSERRDHSRLGCQIRMHESLDGLILFLPERQQ